ncbi:hypothetical protein [Haloferax sp. DFSO60]|uniref:hypothetical protein n=1 Tax=Haloferax sp. DFSO60 TaxID=3388652 RepID=UPI00397A5D1B
MNGEQYSSEETGVCEADEPLEPPKASFTTTLQCVEAAGWWVGCAGSGGVAFVDSTAGLMVPAEPITYSATAYTCGGAMVQTGECHANLAKDAAESAAEQAGEQLACQ